MIERLEDVQPGDIFLGPIGGWFGPVVGAGEFLVDGGWRVGDLDVRHIGIVVEAGRYLPPGTVRHLPTGRYYAPGESGAPVWRDLPMGDYRQYPTGVMAAPRLAQAMPGGAEVVDMTYAQHWTKRCAYARLPEDYRGQADDAAAVALAMVAAGVGYSYLSYPALALWHWGMSTPKLEAWIGRRRPPAPVVMPSWSGTVQSPLALPCEAICSVFADQAWSLTGKKIMVGVPHQCVTPSQLAQRLLTGIPDVVWGWPVAHPYPTLR